MDAASVQIQSSRLFFENEPFGENVEGLLHLICGTLRIVQPGSICFDLMQGISWPLA